MKISKEVFDRQRSPRFGSANPERMRMQFWEWMIRGDVDEIASSPEQVGRKIAGTRLVIVDGQIKSALGPYGVRQRFGGSSGCEDGPIWTFDRMGATCTELADGRIVCVGGEHEDFYDPDFNIYNDVVVFTSEGHVEIYGYPKEIFPTTDFHTATLVGEQLIVIGSVGYPGERSLGKTPVYSLDLVNYSIRKIGTSGEMPGWISRHETSVEGEGAIAVRGGCIFESDQRYVRNLEEYALDLRTASWRRITDRNWRQFAVSQKDGKFFAVQPKMLGVEDLVPSSVERAKVQPEECRAVRILVNGVPVLLEVGGASVEIVIEGSLPDEVCTQLTEEVRRNAEAFLERDCILREL
jgi:hypothetical protein